MASRRTSRRALAIGVGLAVVATVVGVAWTSRPRDPCATEDRRLGVTHGPAGWSAEARWQRWDDGAGCRARIRVALFAPGGTWEDEALAPAGLLEAEVDPSAPPTAAPVWEGDRIEVGDVRFDVSRLPNR